jgi:hypothetical protein
MSIELYGAIKEPAVIREARVENGGFSWGQVLLKSPLVDNDK